MKIYVCCFFLILLTAQNCEAELFRYQNLVTLNDGGSIVLSSERDKAVIGHIEVNAKPCSIGKESVCYMFDDHLFTLTDKKLEAQGYLIENLGVKKIKIFGMEMALERIRVSSEKFVDTYWVDQLRGIQLIEFGLKSTGQTGLFYSREKCGYGAAPECSG